MSQTVVIFGAGGHARVIADTLEAWDPTLVVVAVVDDIYLPQSLHGRPAIGWSEWVQSDFNEGIIGICDNSIRRRMVEKIAKDKPEFQFINAVHPKAAVSPRAVLGSGIAIMAGAVVNAGVTIADQVVVNTQASVDHDCVLGQFCSIGPGAILGGTVIVGESAAVSLGAGILHNRKIGSFSVVGAGAVVTEDVEDHVVAFGVPAKTVRSRAESEAYL